MLFPHESIVIPSRHRANVIMKLVNELAVFWPKDRLFVLVEPHDVKVYGMLPANKFTLTKLPKDNKGLAYAKNFVIDNAEGSVMLMDDDVFGFCSRGAQNGEWFSYRRDPKAGKKLVDHAFLMLEAEYTLVGPQRRTSAFRNDTKRLVAVVAFDAPALRSLGIKYRVNLYEDFDLQLQVMAQKVLVGSCLNEAFDADCGTVDGGLNDGLRNLTEQEKCLAFLMKQWGPCVKRVDKARGPEPKFDWKQFYMRYGVSPVKAVVL